MTLSFLVPGFCLALFHVPNCYNKARSNHNTDGLSHSGCRSEVPVPGVHWVRSCNLTRLRSGGPWGCGFICWPFPGPLSWAELISLELCDREHHSAGCWPAAALVCQALPWVPCRGPLRLTTWCLLVKAHLIRSGPPWISSK